ncbi:MAG: GH92 family glycosyl hydrolase [Rikenellaceae bacterium]|nr:GH92 family glycosyl hydrolase [Rikenellaceae bacterium]
MLLCGPASIGRPYADLVNPLLGTETMWDSAELGFQPTRRTWGAEVYPGSSLPCAMVQLSPVTMFGSGAGYQYEDTLIYGFSHTNKGHWNLNHVPILPVAGNITADDYASPYSHGREEAHPAYYRVYLERYGVDAELTSSLRCGYHRYTFGNGGEMKLLVNLPRSNERVRDWSICKAGPNAFSGYQAAGEKIYFYAVANYSIRSIDSLRPSVPPRDGDGAPGNRRPETRRAAIPVISFGRAGKAPLEIRIGFSFVSVEGARKNLETEIAGNDFATVRREGEVAWNELLGRIAVEGGTERQQRTFYSTLYRSMLWPALRSDVDGAFTGRDGRVARKGFRYYTAPSFWDDYRNKLILLGMLMPDVACDVISSCIDRGRHTGFMPTFFHGDHASVFVTGSYLRGLRNFDLREAYRLMLRNATVEGPSRPFLQEYIDKGYVSELELTAPRIETKARAGVTKTQEYSYDDYAVALLARELGDTASYEMLMRRSTNYRNLYDPSTRFMRGRLADGEWVKDFDPCFPYYHYQVREATGWMSAFFAPHDTEGLIALYGGVERFEAKLDSLFTIPWRGYEAHNLSGFLGQYCHGNQPDHGYPFLYHFVGKPGKSQVVIDSLLNRYYSLGEHHLAYAGMDDAGETSSWYVLSAIGLYTYSPADPAYLVSVPLFDRVVFRLGEGSFTITRRGGGRTLESVEYDGRRINGVFISHADLLRGRELVVRTRQER